MDRNSAAKAPADHDPSANTQPGASSRRSRDGETGGTGTRRGEERSSPPWRVEGLRRDDQGQGGGHGWRWFWLTLLVLLAINWIVASLFMGAARPKVSYTFFLSQVDARNVQQITSTGDTIQGTFK